VSERELGYSGLGCFLTLLLFLIPLFPGGISEGDEKPEMVPPSRTWHPDTIFVNDDDELTDLVGNRGYNGTGSKEYPFIVKDIVIDGSSAPFGFYLGNTTMHIEIRNCTISGVHSSTPYQGIHGAGIWLQGSSNIDVLDCTLRENNQYGIMAVSSGSINLTGNTAVDQPMNIYLFSCSDISVRNCTAVNGTYPIYCYYGEDVSVRCSRISGGEKDGLTLYQGGGMDVSGNLIMDNDGYGIKVQSYRTMVYNNTFLYNHLTTDDHDPCRKQVYCDTKVVAFNRSRTGNHFRDLTSPDNDENGIVDTPYWVAGGNFKDPYPMICSPHDVIPSVPLNLTFESVKRGIRLNWSGPIDRGANGPLEYRIYRETNGEELFINSSDQTGYTDTDVDPDRVYVYSITAVNGIGEGKRSRALSAFIDTEPPFINIIEPVWNTVTREETMELVWQGSDALSGVDHYGLVLDEQEELNLGNRSSYTLKHLESGGHEVRLICYDRAGNSAFDIVGFTVDHTAPVVDILLPAMDQILNTTVVLLSFEVEEGHTSISSLTVTVNSEQIELQKDTRSYYLVGLQDGFHEVWVTCYDELGNKGYCSVFFTKDTNPPDLTIIEPTGLDPPHGESVLVIWNVSEKTTFVYRTLIRVDSGEWMDMYGVTSYRFGHLVDGIHGIKIRVIDGAWNIAERQVNITVDGTPPEVLSYSPVGKNIDVGKLISFTLSEEIPVENVELVITGLSGHIQKSGSLYQYMTSGDLDHGKRYMVLLTVWDEVGNVRGPVEWTFTTVPYDEVSMARLNLTILDDVGKPIENATVICDSVNIYRTGAEGSVSIRLIPGNHSLFVRATGFQGIEFSVILTEGQTKDLGEITLEGEEEDGKESGLKLTTLQIALVVMTSALILLLIALFIFVSRRRKQTTEDTPKPIDPKELYAPIDMERYRTLYENMDLGETCADEIPEEMDEWEEMEYLEEPHYEMDMDFEPIRMEDGEDFGRAPETPASGGVGFSWEDFANPLYDKDPSKGVDLDSMDCYEVLGVDRNSSPRDISLAFRRKAVKYHPDRVMGKDPYLQAAAVEEMKRINFARSVLLDPVSRAEHDARLGL